MSKFVELSKPVLQSATAAAQRGTRQTLVVVLESVLRLLHPIMPFITEEIWLRIAPLAGRTGPTIMLQPYPGADLFARDAAAEAEMRWVMDFILGVRQIRGEMDIAPSKRFDVLLDNAAARDVEVIPGIQKFVIDCNWKLAVDNLFDWYHVAYSHASADAAGLFKVSDILFPQNQMVMLGDYGHGIGGPGVTAEQQAAINALLKQKNAEIVIVRN